MAERQAEAVWRDRVRRWSESGLERKEFAEREGVHPSTLGWWRSELAKRDGRTQDRGPGVALARVHVVEELRSGVPLEVSVGACVVRIPVGFDAPTLERLLAVLGARS